MLNSVRSYDFTSVAQIVVMFNSFFVEIRRSLNADRSESQPP
ncbi:MAG: hypothetical protein OSA51_12020 [Octadecabacter sp.]|nr:hypothetical protein [Octadecabacter sp.]